MIHSCLDGERLISLVCSDRTDAFTDEILNVIVHELSPSTLRTNRSEAVTLKFPGPTGDHSYTTSQWTIILDKIDFSTRFPEHNPDLVQGIYDASQNKIFLNRELFCLKTIVHECLHSCSWGSYDPFLQINESIMFDGLTEFFTGYILAKHFPNSFACWIDPNPYLCNMNYVNVMKIFSSLCTFISILTLTKIYFYDPYSNFNSAFSDFITEVRKVSPGFNNPLGKEIPTYWGIKTECECGSVEDIGISVK